MIFFIGGLAGIIISGFVSRWFYRSAESKTLKPERPFGGAVPPWVSGVYLISFVCALFGLYKIIRECPTEMPSKNSTGRL